MGVTEINAAIGHEAGLQLTPDGICQVGTGFHHDWNVGRASDVETELIVLYAKTAVRGSRLWVPKHGRPTSITTSPSFCIW